MRHLVILAIISISIYACSGSEKSKAGSALADNLYTANEQADPESIWKSKCVSCHGRFGNMGANGAANLQEATSSLDYRIQIITNGKGVMTPWKDILTEDEIIAVAEYTLTFNPSLTGNGK
ncbi:MAG: cytochrome c [Bacteroidota bacterium]